MHKKNKVAVVVLAGGKSSRMGSPKPFLQMNRKSFLETIVDGYKLLSVDHIVVVLNKQFKRFIPDRIKHDKSVFVVLNNHTEKGKIYSLQLGLNRLKGIQNIFIHNIDNPFVELELLRVMLSKSNAYSYVLPLFEGRGGHPILISDSIVEVIIGLKCYEVNMRDVLKRFNRVEVLTDNNDVLTNINTWEDYEKRCLNLYSDITCE